MDDDHAGYPLREEATEPFPPPPPPPVVEHVEERVEPVVRRRRFPVSASPWPLLLVVVLLLGSLGVAYAVTRPRQSSVAGPTQAVAAAAHPQPPAAKQATTPPSPRPPATTTSGSTTPPAAATPTTRAVSVPSLTGSSLPRAIATLKQAGLTAVVARVASTQPEGRVVSQSPSAGANLDRGGRVRLGVAVQQRFDVPDVTGVQGIEAVHTLKRLHLVPALRYVPSTQPARRVVSQWPPAGNKVRPGTSVRLNLSQGLRASAVKVTVPDVIGEDEATATADLEAAGFTVESTDTPADDPADDGMVLSQSPSGGSQAKKGATVTIHVGRS